MVRSRTGTVLSFDSDRGWGRLVGDGDGAEFDFHCTAVADGSRQVPVGARVSFVVVPGDHGRWQAGAVRLEDR